MGDGGNGELGVREGGNGQSEAERQQGVREVVISRRNIGVDEWLQALAEDITRAAARDTAAREALERLLRS